MLGEAVKIEVGKFPGAKFIELFLVYLDNVAVPDQRVVRGVPGVCLPEQQGSGQQAKQQDKAEQRRGRRRGCGSWWKTFFLLRWSVFCSFFVLF